jgi:deazaflavin-dependent oxidoreductase (nitroreductase family)
VFTATFVGIAVFERIVPLRVRRWYQKHIGTPVFKTVCGVAPGYAVLETTGRRTGNRHQVPVGGRLSGDMFWLISAVGRRSHFLLNIEADPLVRLRVHGRWRPGTAQVRPREELDMVLKMNRFNGLFILMANDKEDMIPVRIDLTGGPA